VRVIQAFSRNHDETDVYVTTPQSACDLSPAVGQTVILLSQHVRDHTNSDEDDTSHREDAECSEITLGSTRKCPEKISRSSLAT